MPVVVRERSGTLTMAHEYDIPPDHIYDDAQNPTRRRTVFDRPPSTSSPSDGVYFVVADEENFDRGNSIDLDPKRNPYYHTAISYEAVKEPEYSDVSSGSMYGKGKSFASSSFHDNITGESAM